MAAAVVIIPGRLMLQVSGIQIVLVLVLQVQLTMVRPVMEEQIRGAEVAEGGLRRRAPAVLEAQELS